MKIPNYSLYEYNDNKIINTKTGKEVTLTPTSKSKSPYCKLKNDGGVWKSISLSKVQALCCPPKPPDGFELVPGYERTFISRNGIVWLGPTESCPLGKYASAYVSAQGYVSSTTETHSRFVHILLALTFLDPQYLEKSLCVMHLDNDKTNFSLSNLKLGTYSENNQHAYDTGVNLGPTKQRKLNQSGTGTAC